MTNEEILKKVIEKAKSNGWKTTLKERQAVNMPELFIFSHDFARAFFEIEWEDGDTISTPMSEILAQENIKKWQHHLRQMVLEEEPLKYLKQFIK